MHMRAVLVFLALAVLGCGCSRTRVVELESRTLTAQGDSLTRVLSAWLAERMLTEQSVKVELREKATYTLNEAGDTTKAVIERVSDSSKEFRSRELRLLAVIDSLEHSKARVDSVYVEKPVAVESIKEVNRLKWWQKGLMWAGVAGLTALLAFMAFKLGRRR